VVDDFTLVGFLALDPHDEDSIDAILCQADMVRGRSPCLADMWLLWCSYLR
jgi:hypothetical protein